MEKVSVIDLARGRWPEIYKAMGICVEEYFSHAKFIHRPCPICGGTDRFRFDNWDKFCEIGSYFCSSCGAGAGFKFMQQFRQGTFRDQALFVENLFGSGVVGSSPQIVVPSAHVGPTPQELEATKRRLMKTWSTAHKVKEEDPVWKYLVQTRMLPIMRWPNVVAGLRYHPKGRYCEEDGTLIGSFPMMLAKVAANDGKVATIHRTFLTLDGLKAPVGVNKQGKDNPVKKLMHGFPASGGAIRLCAAEGDTLALTEGIETALAVLAMTGLPVWACVSAPMLKTVAVPPHVRKVIIFADNDLPDARGWRAGNEAAEELRKRLVAEGRQVEVHFPAAAGTDFHDLWVEKVISFRTVQAEKAQRGSTTIPAQQAAIWAAA